MVFSNEPCIFANFLQSGARLARPGVAETRCWAQNGTQPRMFQAAQHAATQDSTVKAPGWRAACTLAVLALAAGLLAAQQRTVSPQQQATASRTAEAGLPLAELAPQAPERYTVKPGDTLWGLSALFLTRPWRWPELWGMNLAEIRNPHLIYPGQLLLLERRDGRASLRLADAAEASAVSVPPTVRLSPRVRVEMLSQTPVPALKSSVIDPFLIEAVVVQADTLQTAARIVAAQDSRVLLTRGDRAYALGAPGAPLLDQPGQPAQAFQVLRPAQPLKDPQTGELLGYAAHYLGRALLVRSESAPGAAAGQVPERVPATLDIAAVREEIRVGDRLLPEPAPTLRSYTPHAPAAPIEARVAALYGNAASQAGQNQVVVINRGTRDGLESGHVLAILTNGARLSDTTDPARTPLKLPDERKGLLMVFRTFDRLSYALILETHDGVGVGDRLVNPR